MATLQGKLVRNKIEFSRQLIYYYNIYKDLCFFMEIIVTVLLNIF